MAEPDQYEEYHVLPPVWGWFCLVLFSAGIISWGLFIHAIVPDAPRRWDFGVLPTTPAQSVYTTAEPGEGPVPQQMAPLPDRQPMSPKGDVK